MRIFLAIAFCCAASLGGAQTPTPIEQPKSPAPSSASHALPTGRLTGTVFCSDTRKPCRGAGIFVRTVTSTPESEREFQFEAVTGMDGTYSFDNLPAGNYFVVGNLTGYLTSYIPPDSEKDLDPAALAAASAARLRGMRVDVASSQTSTHDLTLLRGASVSGRVLYADGTPAINALIRVEHADPNRATGEPDKDHHVVPTTPEARSTNDRGEFRIAGIRPGYYRVSASPRLQDPDEMRTSSPAIFTVYSGDTIHRKAAKIYELRLGDDVGNIDITIPIGGLHRVSGRLATTGGEPLNMGLLTLTSTDDSNVFYNAEPDRSGAYSFLSVPPGTYTLTLSSAFINIRAESTNGAQSEDTDLKPARAFTADATPVLVKESDLSDLDPVLKEIPLPPIPKDKDDPN